MLFNIRKSNQVRQSVTATGFSTFCIRVTTIKGKIMENREKWERFLV